ncbi:MAG: ATP-binding protein, partial [Myxococcota bacterium]|nr:ATP-binding protein [Myxococcota bacterium]
MDRRITGFSENLVAEETPSNLYVAREDDLASLKEHWAAARDGDPRAVLLQGPLGAGKRAMMGELTRAALGEDEDTLIWRVGMSDEQDGTQSLVRMYAGLFQALHKSPLVRGRVEMALNAALPHQPQRVQKWYQAFIEGLKQGAPKPGNQEFQVIMPRDNPLIGLVEVATAIARKFPVIFEIQNLHNSQSLAIHAFVEAVLHEIEGDDVDDDPMHLLMVLGVEPADDVGKTWMSLPLVDLLERRADDLDVVDLQRWGEEEVGRYLTAKGLTSNAAEIARIADGLPGFVAELVDWLEAEGRLSDDLTGISLSDVADTTPDADELEGDDDEPADSDEGTPGNRKKATAGDAERVAYLAALLGLSFPSGLLADMAGFERESVDDLLDATEGIYKELQFSKPLGTWIYQFHKALLRESVLQRHQTDEDKQLAARVCAFMERFLVGRGYPYLVKALRVYAAADQPQRAAVLRSMALGADQPQVWAMLHDHLKYFDDTAWPTPMRRTVYMHLVDRMVKGGDVNQTEGLWNEA